jgi:formate hydrogenlyase subunit 4
MQLETAIILLLRFLAIILFSILFGFFLSWVERKLTARMQGRIGPPYYQPLADFLKLILAKEDLTPASSSASLFTIAPIASLVTVALAMLFIPLNSVAPTLSFTGDVVLVFFLLTASTFMTMLGGSASSSPFGAVGASRLMTQTFAFELPLFISLTSVAIQSGSLSLSGIASYQLANGALFWRLLPAAVAAVLCIPGKLSLAPFNIPNAQTEIVEGSLTEYSGAKLGLFYLASAIEWFVVTSLIADLFFIISVGNWLAGILLHLTVCLILAIVVTTIKASTARLRIDQALRFYWVGVNILALLGLALPFIWRGIG